MATSAQIRQQLVEALQLDLIGPGWDDVALRQERLPQPPLMLISAAAPAVHHLLPQALQLQALRCLGGEQQG